jgi:hypothetical protein
MMVVELVFGCEDVVILYFTSCLGERTIVVRSSYREDLSLAKELNTTVRLIDQDVRLPFNQRCHASNIDLLSAL